MLRRVKEKNLSIPFAKVSNKKDYLILQFSEQRAQRKLIFYAESRERIVEFFDRKIIQ